MDNYKPNIFFSYTLRGKIVSKELLSKIASSFSPISNLFIDIIHNDSVDKQRRVLSELNNADILILLKTDNISSSKWVNLELSIARKNKTPIYEIGLDELTGDYQTSINKLIEGVLLFPVS